jgi:hypothetical protein
MEGDTEDTAHHSGTARKVVDDNIGFSRASLIYIQRKAKFDRCTTLQRPRLSPGFALAELSFFRENLILKGSPPRNIPGQIGS